MVELDILGLANKCTISVLNYLILCTSRLLRGLVLSLCIAVCFAVFFVCVLYLYFCTVLVAY